MLLPLQGALLIAIIPRALPGIFEPVRHLNVICLVKPCPQLYQYNHFFSILRSFNQCIDNLIAECKKAGYETFGEEGRNTADWIVVDLGQTIVHIMQRDAREMYQLEKLWA